MGLLFSVLSPNTLFHTKSFLFYSICVLGSWTCDRAKCPGICSAYGNGIHMLTFDGMMYSFQPGSASCAYTLFEVSNLTGRLSKQCRLPITKTRLFKYMENFTSKKTENFQIKNTDFFSYFCSKHRLWVLVRTASARRF